MVDLLDKNYKTVILKMLILVKEDMEKVKKRCMNKIGISIKRQKI
jgi:hypothetical protein